MGAVLVVVGAGCGSSGRELREVPPGQTAPPRSTSSTRAPGTVTTAPRILHLTSPEWDGGGTLPVDLSCDGQGRSPALTWTDVPGGMSELAIVARDDTAEGRIHWIVTGIAPTDGTVAAAELPLGSVEWTNDGGSTAWDPLCPPEGAEHLYSIELMALPEAAEPSTGDPATDVSALERQATHRSVLTGSFAR